MYAHESRLRYCYNFYNFLNINHYMVDIDKPIAADKNQVRTEFHYGGDGFAKKSVK